MKNCIWCNNDCKLDCKSKINKMKQYKHTQSQDVVEQVSITSGWYQSTKVPMTNVIAGKYIENTNDWVEITKPEYTILTLWAQSSTPNKYKNDRVLASYDNAEIGSYDRPLCKTYPTREKWLTYFHQPLWNIHSVRRESDGEVFTVGDTVRLNFNVASIIKVINKIGLETIRGCSEKLYIYTNGEQSTINNYVKVQPKEWEITAFRYKNHHPTWSGIWNLNGGGYVSSADNKCVALLNTFFETPGYEIYSVHRESDGLILTVGDNTPTGIIKSFILKEGTIGYASGEHTSWVGLKVWRKIEKLFTTEDGVDIYEGKEVFVIHPTTLNTIVGITTIEYSSYKGWLFFSTEQALEEYILMNKPQYSLKQIYDKLSLNLDELKTIFK